LVRCDAAFYRVWPDRARRNVAGRPGVPADLRHALDRIADRYDDVVARLTEIDVTLTHGEFYGSNILVRETPPAGAAGRICPVDWEMASWGPGLLDLAALTSGGWSGAEREAMASAYRCAMADAGSTLPSLPRLLESLDWCRLHLAVQWLGWADDHWQAPPDQAHDWLGEAARLAGALRL
jgi:thiamine kinase-like enzyme